MKRFKFPRKKRKDVEPMKAKEYLKHLKRLDTIINQKLQELSDLRLKMASPPGIDYSKDRVQTSPSGEAPFVRIMDRVMELEAEINDEVDRFVDEKHKIINQIQGLKDSRCIEILFKRYVEYKSLETIAVELNYTYQYTRELHGHALQEFQRTYNTLLKSYKPLV